VNIPIDDDQLNDESRVEIDTSGRVVKIWKVVVGRVL
jgi:hypothetical protein